MKLLREFAWHAREEHRISCYDGTCLYRHCCLWRANHCKSGNRRFTLLEQELGQSGCLRHLSSTEPWPDHTRLSQLPALLVIGCKHVIGKVKKKMSAVLFVWAWHSPVCLFCTKLNYIVETFRWQEVHIVPLTLPSVLWAKMTSAWFLRVWMALRRGCLSSGTSVWWVDFAFGWGSQDPVQSCENSPWFSSL